MASSFTSHCYSQQSTKCHSEERSLRRGISLTNPRDSSLRSEWHPSFHNHHSAFRIHPFVISTNDVWHLRESPHLRRLKASKAVRWLHGRRTMDHSENYLLQASKGRSHARIFGGALARTHARSAAAHSRPTLLDQQRVCGQRWLQLPLDWKQPSARSLWLCLKERRKKFFLLSSPLEVASPVTSPSLLLQWQAKRI